MEERKLNLDAPFLSVRRISTRPESSSESEKEKKVMNEKSNRVIDSCPNTAHQTPVCLPDQSFDHLTEPASVPFVWEQTPGRPKNMTDSDLLKEEELIENTCPETVQEQGDDEDNEVYSDALDMASSNGYFSVNCSSSGVSEFEKNAEKSGMLSEEIPEYRNLMMSRFLPAAKAMALKQQKQQQQNHQIASPGQKKKHTILSREAVVPERKPLVRKHETVAIPSHCEGMNDIDEESEEGDDDDDDDDHGHDYSYGRSIYSNVSKKGWGFLPRLCAKNSLSVLNPVPSLRIKTCQDLRKPGQIIQPRPINYISKQTLGISAQSSPRIRRSNRIMNDSGDLQQPMTPSWSSRRLSGFISPYRYASSRSSLSESGFLGTPEKPEIFRANRLYRGISKSQELYPRNTRETMGFSNSPVAKSAEIRMTRNSIPRTPSRMQKQEPPFTRSHSIQDTKFLAEEVKRRRSNNRSGNLLQTSPVEVAVSPPPLPKTPSESWLVRTLPSVTPRSSISNPYIAARANSKNLLQEAPESTKWETIVKTSYVHHDHVRYSEELIVHPSRLHKT